jgi:hypothetical protein
MWDRVCSAQGIEARHPILDRDLVEFCMAVPWRERMAGGQSKALLRRAGILPPGHTNQGYMHNANSNARLAICAGVVPWLAGRLENPRILERSWFRTGYLVELLQRFRASVRTGATPPELLEEAFEVVAFDGWGGPTAS